MRTERGFGFAALLSAQGTAAFAQAQSHAQKRKMKKEYTPDCEQLARFAKALGHPARITILEFLASQESCFFGDIHEELPIAKATVSQHLKELKDAGLIQGEITPPKVKYCINRENWEVMRGLFEKLALAPSCSPKGGESEPQTRCGCEEIL
ncbi:MAG: ArsR/SmtB family transcription factor [Mangrovibacterium sp.]